MRLNISDLHIKSERSASKNGFSMEVAKAPSMDMAVNPPFVTPIRPDPRQSGLREKRVVTRERRAITRVTERPRT